MLEKFTMNGQIIPTPIPIETLGKAIDWINHTFIDKQKTITKILFNGKNIDEYIIQKTPSILSQKLFPESCLDIQIDSSLELLLITTKTISQLTLSIREQLEQLSIELWRQHSKIILKTLKNILQDLFLLIDLNHEVIGLFENRSHVDIAPIQALTIMLRRYGQALSQAYKNSHWKQCSHLLLNRIAPISLELISESQNLHIKLLETVRKCF